MYTPEENLSFSVAKLGWPCNSYSIRIDRKVSSSYLFLSSYSMVSTAVLQTSSPPEATSYRSILKPYLEKLGISPIMSILTTSMLISLRYLEPYFTDLANNALGPTWIGLL